MLKLYIIGLCILVIAILANFIIGKLGIMSWYEFLQQLKDWGPSGLNEVSFLDYLWLFIGYPLVLGCGYLLGNELYQLFTN